MKSPTPSSTYLVRNRYGYCFRIKVPKELQPLIQKKELRYSLRTGYLGLAKSRARLLAGLFQQLFRKLREPEMGSELTKQEIDDIIDNFEVEGKVSEPFGPLVSEWYVDPSQGKTKSLSF